MTMHPNLLILGGTLEATALARLTAGRRIAGIVSLAGRVERPRQTPLPQRVGGYGGSEGLAAFLRAARITHVIDATHPFAAQISRNATAACAATGTPLLALTRPPWRPQPGDTWTRVPDLAGAVAALSGRPMRVMLAVGRMHLADFAPNPQHHYLLRLVDPPTAPLPLPQTQVIVDRGPFDARADLALMERHRIEIVVSKNAGGAGAYAKIAAARALGLPVVMIDRPALPERHEVTSPEAALEWVAHAHGVSDLGV